MGINDHYETGDAELEAAQAALPAIPFKDFDIPMFRELAAQRNAVAKPSKGDEA